MFVDGVDEAIDRRAKIESRRAHVFDLGAEPPEALEEVVVGREVEILQDDLAPRPVVTKSTTRRSTGLRWRSGAS